MMEKSALAGEGGGARPPPFRLLSSRTNLQCTLLLRGQIHSLYFISTLYVLCGVDTWQIHSPYFNSIPICSLWFTPHNMHLIKAKSATIRHIWQRIYRSSAGRRLFSVHLACRWKLAKNGSVRKFFANFCKNIWIFAFSFYSLLLSSVCCVCRVYLLIFRYRRLSHVINDANKIIPDQ